MNINHLKQLEAESIFIIREVAACFEKPCMFYSIGKDSTVMLHLARKAFYPAPPPFPLLHIDTRWKFQEMYLFRDFMARESGMDLLVHTNVVTPNRLTDEQRLLFEQLAASMGTPAQAGEKDSSLLGRIRDAFS